MNSGDNRQPILCISLFQEYSGQDYQSIGAFSQQFIICYIPQATLILEYVNRDYRDFFTHDAWYTHQCIIASKHAHGTHRVDKTADLTLNRSIALKIIFTGYWNLEVVKATIFVLLLLESW